MALRKITFGKLKKHLSTFIFLIFNFEFLICPAINHTRKTILTFITFPQKYLALILRGIVFCLYIRGSEGIIRATFQAGGIKRTIYDFGIFQHWLYIPRFNKELIIMMKSVFTKDYSSFLKLLREERKKRGVTQEEMAKKLGVTQAFISKCERGERRIDIVELSRFCEGIGISFLEFIKRLEAVRKSIN
ncbi:MAG: helix-turn-helix domain-containing protein [Planctomycetota bacterium]